MRIAIIAAKSDNNVIGKGNDLIWHLPADQTFFLDQIKNNLLLTGRRSFESPHGSLIFKDNSAVIVVTRQAGYDAGLASVVSSLETGIELARKKAYDRLCILGGSEIYRVSIELADELIITEVHAIFEGDRFFPEINPGHWTEVHREDHKKDADNPYDYSFVFYERKDIVEGGR